jgi:hypothetical protein
VQNLSLATKWLVYAALNLTFCVALVAGAGIGGGGIVELPYVTLLFAICSSPVLFVGPLNGSFAMLGVAMAAYFVEFGMLDAASMLSPPKPSSRATGVLDGAEVVIIVGALMQVAGFHLAARLTAAQRADIQFKDWPRTLLPIMGLLLWSSGCAAGLYQSLYVQADNSNASIVAGFTKLGVWSTSGLIFVANYAGRLGIVILAYWWAVWDRRFSNALVLFVIVVQFAVGWIVDTKEVALSAPLVLLLTRFVVLGKLPLRWVAYAIIAMVLVFPVLTAKRIIMTERLNLTRAQALPYTAEILWRAIQERTAAREGKYEQKTQSFLERANDKGSIEVFVEHVGVDHPYQMGATFEPMLYIFVPRVVWSDKPGDNSSQTFNREFHLSEDRDTHINTTHLGEFYWNFGFVGMVIGMAMSGALLGFVCTRFDPSIQTSMSRTLVIIVTLYDLVAHGSGQIEIDYVVWIRTLLLIGLLHLIFETGLGRPAARGTSEPTPSQPGPQSPQRSLFPNLLR